LPFFRLIPHCCTPQAVAKRLRVTGSGKVVGRRAGKQHFNEKQTTNKKRELSHMFVVQECDLYKVARCLPYAGLAK
jgi:large subunit ribosomal protein L35